MMEISEVRKRVVDTIDRAKKAAADRRARMDEGAREYAVFLERVAAPTVRSVANVLKASGYPFTVMTPSGSLRMVSERSADDYLELEFDSTGDDPQVMGRTNRARGRRIVESERPLGGGRPIRSLEEEDVLAWLLSSIEPFVER